MEDRKELPNGLRRFLLEREQFVAIVLILLASRLDFSRKAVGERSGEGIETVENVDDPLLLSERRDGDEHLGKARNRKTWLRSSRLVLLELGSR